MVNRIIQWLFRLQAARTRLLLNLFLVIVLVVFLQSLSFNTGQIVGVSADYGQSKSSSLGPSDDLPLANHVLAVAVSARSYVPIICGPVATSSTAVSGSCFPSIATGAASYGPESR
jgi:hypothetical protein